MASVYGMYSSIEQEQIRYIGITKHDDPAIRVGQHINTANRRRGKSYHWPVYCWIRKHVESGNTIKTTLFASGLTWADACAMEIELIAKYRQLHGNLMNLTDGGDGRSGYSHSENTKTIMSASAKKRLESPEAREKIADAMRNRIISSETRQRMSDANRRRSFRPLTEEHKKKIGDAHRGRKNVYSVGRPHTEEAKKKISASQRGKKRKPHTEETKKKIGDACRARAAMRSSE